MLVLCRLLLRTLGNNETCLKADNVFQFKNLVVGVHQMSYDILTIISKVGMTYMGNVRDVVAPNITRRPQPLFIIIILMYLCNLSPSH